MTKDKNIGISDFARTTRTPSSVGPVPIAILDFETTGLSPAMGDRATEIAIVLLEDGRIVDRFQSLMNAGVRVNAFIESYTGITNEMLADAPPAEEVMEAASRFVGDAPLVAHNASFDQRFWEMELTRVGWHSDATPPNARSPFACTMLLSRRLYPEARRFALGSLAAFHDISFSSRAHRAMADAEVAALLLARIQRDLERRWDVFDCSHELLVKVQKTPKKKVPDVLKAHVRAALDCGSEPAMTTGGAMTEQATTTTQGPAPAPASTPAHSAAVLLST